MNYGLKQNDGIPAVNAENLDISLQINCWGRNDDIKGSVSTPCWGSKNMVLRKIHAA